MTSGCPAANKIPIKLHFLGRESKPLNSDFCQNDFLSTREYTTHGAHCQILIALDQLEPL